MRSFFKKFWQIYEKNYSVYTGIAAGLFLLQIAHLYWLTASVVAGRLFGITFFDPNPFWQFVIVLVDYVEIPAIVSTSLLYLYSLQKKWNAKDLILLLLLNSQWLHIFWISDEFVVDMFQGVQSSTILPLWLAWVAITIDYLELPVMYDTTKKFLQSLAKNNRQEHDKIPGN